MPSEENWRFLNAPLTFNLTVLRNVEYNCLFNPNNNDSFILKYIMEIDEDDS